MTENGPVADARVAGKDILIVGGAGFVGSNLSHMLLGRGVSTVTIVDNLLSSDPSNLPIDPRARFIYGSITEPRILEQLAPAYDYVFHLACYHGNQSSIADPMADHANNLLPSLVLFDYLARNVDVHRVVYAAAGCAVAEKVYGEAQATREDAPVSMFQDSPYSISKIVGEMYGNYFWQRSGLPFVKARFQNVYGPREILGAGRWRGTPATIWRNVVPTFIWRALHDMPLRLDGDGQTGRDFIFVRDLCEGLVACAASGKPSESYNLSTGIETSIAELAETVTRMTGSNAPIERVPRRSWDRSGNRYGDPRKSRDELGFEAAVSLNDGIRKTIEWTRAQRDLISHCIASHGPLLATSDPSPVER